MQELLQILESSIQSGSLLAFVFVFLGGILISLTPCVYPLIPITVGFIGANSSSKLRGFILSLFYVLGVAITYSILGIIAALTGRIFGSFTTNPIVYIVVGIIFIILGLSMLGVLDVPIFNFGLKPASVKKKGVISAIAIGLVSGLVVAPCTAPALGAILAYVATKKNILFGAGLLFCFAYGMGFLLILIGTFSGAVAILPKSGAWMLGVKKTCGVILLLTGVYFLISARGF